MSLSAPQANVNGLYDKIHARVKLYLENSEGAWVDETGTFLDETLPNLKEDLNSETLIAATREFCESITSSKRKAVSYVVPSVITSGVSWATGYQGSPLKNDLEAYCADFLKEKSAFTIEDPNDRDELKPKPDEESGLEEALDTDLASSSTHNDASTSSTPANNALEKEEEPEKDMDLSEQDGSLDDSKADSEEKGEDVSKSVKSEDALDELEREQPKLGPLDTLMLKIQGGEEAQALLIQQLEKELAAVKLDRDAKLKEKDKEIATLMATQQATQKLVQTLSEENAGFYENNHAKIGKQSSRMK